MQNANEYVENVSTKIEIETNVMENAKSSILNACELKCETAKTLMRNEGGGYGIIRIALFACLQTDELQPF